MNEFSQDNQQSSLMEQPINESRSPFTYLSAEELGDKALEVERLVSFDIASSDRDVLAKVDTVLKRQGYLALGDVAGRQHYLIEGRRNQYHTAHMIESLTQQELERLHPMREYDERILRQAIEQILAEAGIPRKLRGYQVIRFILQLVVPDETIMRPLKKSLYPKVGEYFHMTVEQVDRVLRYCLKKAGWEQGNSVFIATCRDETISRYETLETEYSSI